MPKARLGGLRIARVHGVEIKLHFSLIFLLIYVFMIADVQFPFVLQQSGIAPDSVTLGSGAWGALFALGLFLSVLIHEFAHVLVAQSMGVKVEGITLMMLGGVSEMERIPEKPYAEFKVSIVGPLMSFALWGVLLLIEGATSSGDLAFFCYWLSRVNFMLGVFNLLPAIPLDGGRAFRSFLAAKSGMASATRTSVSVAHGFAWVLGILGVLSFNILLVLIAFFVYSAATSELVVSMSKGMLQGMKAGAAARLVEPIDEDATLRTAAARMLASGCRELPVETRTVGAAILESKRLREVPRELWDETRVSQVMDRVSRVLDSDEPLDDLLPELARAQALPLSKNGHIVGLVDFRDISDLLELKGLTEQPRRAA